MVKAGREAEGEGTNGGEKVAGLSEGKKGGEKV
jgi:hypothetical protein